MFLGGPEAGIALAEKAMRLNPMHPNWDCAYAAVPYFLAPDLDRALELGRKARDVPFCGGLRDLLL